MILVVAVAVLVVLVLLYWAYEENFMEQCQKHGKVVVDELATEASRQAMND